MKVILLKYFALFLFFFFLGSCKKEGSTQTIPIVTGDLVGTIVLKNDGGQLTDNSGVLISIEGTTLKTFSDKYGNWSVKEIPEGKNDISFSKENFSTYKKIDYEIKPNQTNNFFYYDLYLYEIPSYKITDLAYEFLIGGKVEITGKISQKSNELYRYSVLFISSDSTVCSDPSKYIFVTEGMIYLDSINFYQTFYLSDFYNEGFKSGSTVNMICYAMPSMNYGYYKDKNTDRKVYGCLSKTPSNKISFTLP